MRIDNSIKIIASCSGDFINYFMFIHLFFRFSIWLTQTESKWERDKEAEHSLIIAGQQNVVWMRNVIKICGSLWFQKQISQYN